MAGPSDGDEERQSTARICHHGSADAGDDHPHLGKQGGSLTRRKKGRNSPSTPPPLPVSFTLGSHAELQSSWRSVLIITAARTLTAMAILLSASSHSGAGLLRFASATAIGPPELDRCDPDRHECCLPRASSLPTPFRVNFSTPMRTRPALQTAAQDPDYLRKLRDAYARLRDLSDTAPDDPRSLRQQRHIHCAFCDESLPYGAQFNMHGNWFFLPWHRMLLYYHERILAWACGDSAFALPFWNWDNAAGRDFPSVYADDVSSPLYTRYRREAGDMQRLIDVGVRGQGGAQSDVLHVYHWRHFIGTSTYDSYGSLEGGGHNAVHEAVGRAGDRREMGDLRHAAYDPVFYAHHANVDRLWSVWLTLRPGPSGRRRGHPTSRSFLDSRFIFYDHDAMAKIIAVSDVLDHERNLRYRFEPITNDWLEEGDLLPAAAASMTAAAPAATPPAEGERLNHDHRHPPPKTFRAVPTPNEDASVFSANIQSPDQSPDQGVDPILAFHVARNRKETVELHVFINLPEVNADVPGEGNPNHVGGFLLLPGVASKFSFTLSIEQTLQNLGLTLSSNFTVQVVRGVDFCVPSHPITIHFIDFIHDLDP